MGRAGDRVFVDAGRRGEEPGDEVIGLARGRRRRLGASRHHDPPHRDLRQTAEVRTHGPHLRLRRYLDEIVGPIAADPAWLDAQRLDQTGRGVGRGRLLRGEIELNLRIDPGRGEQARAGLEAGLTTLVEPARLP